MYLAISETPSTLDLVDKNILDCEVDSRDCTARSTCALLTLPGAEDLSR